MRWGGPKRMYHPYFRGKQFELLSVREMAPVIKHAGFRPIIEPVRNDLGGLNRALDALVEIEGQPSSSLIRATATYLIPVLRSATY